VREDPFSSYPAGFEVRTCRLCRRMLMFHHIQPRPMEHDNPVPPTRSAHPVAGESRRMTAEQLFFNGIDGATGDYLLPPLTVEQVAKMAVEETDAAHRAELKGNASREPHFAPAEGVEPKDLAQAGWGVIFAHGADPAIRDALGELLAHRHRQAMQIRENRYREFTGVQAYRPEESKHRFLARHGAGPGAVDPDKMPYYLMIVGDPEAIPYRFQYQLDVQHAVGRIQFETLDEYARYARRVVEAETAQVSSCSRISFFGVRNSADRATQLSADHLVKPLAKLVAADKPDWIVQTIIGEEATKARLARLLGGDETPDLLFTASHGMGFPNGDARQLAHQGALLCQDWPGPAQWHESIPEEFYFSADDVDETARLSGLISFHFACYGAGTPRFDDFAHQSPSGSERSAIAPHAFVARLAQRLLAHSKAGPLAVIGHVERAWHCSFFSRRAGAQLTVFQSALKRLMEGHPVGSAMEYFNQRYSELSTDLSMELEDIRYGALVDDTELAGLWTANNDARAYAIIGDPAVRLAGV
jgi:hypothetical protein